MTTSARPTRTGDPASAEVGTGAGDRTDRRYLLGVIALTVTAFAMSAVPALTLPFFDGPDEHRHVNSVVRVAGGGGWPDAYEARMHASVYQAMVESGSGALGTGVRTAPVAPALRSSLADLTELAGHRDTMVQHPPLYYQVTGLGVRVVGLDARWDHGIHVMRLTSAAILAVAFPFLVGAVRWATGSRTAGLVGGTAPLGIPFFSVMGGYVSNDTLLITACTATMYLLVRAVRDVRSQPWSLPAAGAAWGAALLTKGFALMLAPAVLVLAVVALRRSARPVLARVGTALLAGVLALAVGGWWWVRNLLVYGKLQPSQYAAREPSPTGPEDYSLSLFLVKNARRMVATFWGRGAHAEVASPVWLTVAATTLLVATILLALSRRRARCVLLLALVHPALIAATLFRNAHGIYWDLGLIDRGIQGRYLYSGIVALAVAVGTCLLLAVDGRSRRARRAIVLAATAALPVAGSLGIAWIVTRTWGRFCGDLDMCSTPLADHTGVPAPLYVALGLGWLAGLVVLLGRTGRLAARAPRYHARGAGASPGRIATTGRS